ncbi:hypothetical protein GE09DRAFT_310849 [Coniochaeta sp. 2T2.1]|nr:hypothetical protein GE09DRAFT_310849 [Coniochaeta sp. 2T2.1]
MVNDGNPTRKRMRKRKSCFQCTKAKRKCDKTAPACKRCIERGDACRYQLLPHLPVSIAPVLPVLTGGDVVDASGDDVSASVSPISTVQDNNGRNRPATYADLSFPSPASRPQQPTPPFQASNTGSSEGSAPASSRSRCKAIHDRWFLDPESWDTQQIPRPDLAIESPVSEETLRHFIGKLQDWLRRWVEKGHSPLMHSQLYRGHMPDCVQDAFTALTAYYSMTPTTKLATMRMINSRATKLVETQPHVYLGSDDPEFAISAPSLAFDTLTHVARTQALFIYQMIRLFDGDIRSRALAEEQKDTLSAWAYQMFASARLDCSGVALLSTEEGGCSDVPRLSDSSDNRMVSNTVVASAPVNGNVTTLSRAVPSDPPSLWRAWILAESVRRTYLMALFMQSVYHNIKHGWAVCPGGASFTARCGLWDAPTAWSWYKESKREAPTSGARGSVSKSLLLLESLDAWNVLHDNRREDVDEFTTAVLESCYGLDLVENWGSGIDGMPH